MKSFEFVSNTLFFVLITFQKILWIYKNGKSGSQNSLKLLKIIASTIFINFSKIFRESIRVENLSYKIASNYFKKLLELFS